MPKATFKLFPRINHSACSSLDRVMGSQSEFDWVAYKHYWEFPINKKIIPRLICLNHCLFCYQIVWTSRSRMQAAGKLICCWWFQFSYVCLRAQTSVQEGMLLCVISHISRFPEQGSIHLKFEHFDSRWAFVTVLKREWRCRTQCFWIL